MLQKRDIILIVAVLVAAGLLYGVTQLAQSGQALSGTVEIYVDGALYAEAPISETREIAVRQADGKENIVSIEGEGVHMAHASCDNQHCVQQGEVTPDNWTRRSLGRTIICLPNRVLVELALDEGHPTMEDYDVPDV